MQIGAGGQCISADKLRGAIDASTTLHQVLLRFAHAFMIQATHTALANGRSKIEARLARWLLMATTVSMATSSFLRRNFSPPCLAYAARV